MQIANPAQGEKLLAASETHIAGEARYYLSFLRISRTLYRSLASDHSQYCYRRFEYVSKIYLYEVARTALQAHVAYEHSMSDLHLSKRCLGYAHHTPCEICKDSRNND